MSDHDAGIPVGRLTVDTAGPGLTEVTPRVADWLDEAVGHLRTARHTSGARAVHARCTGLLTVFVRHTSCSLLIQENADPDVRTDLEAFFRRLVPHSDDPAMGYLRHTTEGPDDMPAHIKAALLPVSLQVPVIDGRLALGTWQGLYLYEHRDRPHRREVVLALTV